MKHLRAFWKLAAAERWVLLQAVLLVATVRLCLLVVPFRTLHRKWTLLLPRMARPGRGMILPPEKIVWLVAVASRFVPGAHCLARSVAAQLLLARQGQLAQLHIGVRKQVGSLDAHAWLEYDDRPLFESGVHLSQFTPLAAIGPSSPDAVPTPK